LNVTTAVAQETDLLARAVRAIASETDLGTGPGFLIGEIKIGHYLAVKPFDEWTYPQKMSMFWALKKYRRQLQNHGIEVDAIARPFEPETQRYGAAPIESRRIEMLRDGGFHVQFAMDGRLQTFMKRLAGSQWQWASKSWIVPPNPVTAESLLAFAIDNRFTVSDATKLTLSELAKQSETAKMALEASRAVDAEIIVPGLGGELRPFQRAGVAYATKSERCFIADEMGLGKTVQAIACLQFWNAFPAVIVCPASLKLNWARELMKWLPGRTIQIWTSTRGRDADLIIINYDILQKRLDQLKTIKAKGVVFDESHKLKSRGAQRSRAAEEIAGASRYRLCLSGTPILNRPAELVHQLRILGRLEQLGGEKGFPKKIAERNLPELNNRIRALCYIRRLKKDVLKDLPEKQRSIVPIEIDNRAEYERVERDLIEWLRDKARAAASKEAAIMALPEEEREAAREARADAAESRARYAEQLIRLNALKRLTAEGKLAAVIKWISDFLESGEKLVVFAYHVAIVDKLADHFRAPKIRGGMDQRDVQGAKDRFQDDPKCRVIILNLEAGGVGHTLTAASNVAFVELGWTPALHDQAEDRCHRIGQEFQVTAYYLLGENTIDEKIQALIEQKRKVVTAATDGQISKSVSLESELIAQLIGGK
jgi:SWI/SNF-related matrix-associated actin-dependent regulator 1 of chromatin subfamily A